LRLIGLGRTATPQQIAQAVEGWLRGEALRVFEERCRVFAERLQVRPSLVTLSAARTRWGSATAQGVIRLNWRLIHFSEATIDYVVAHELAHLREMNHGVRFWELVRSVVPDYEQRRGRCAAPTCRCSTDAGSRPREAMDAVGSEAAPQLAGEPQV
jgi:predicted metal-dependent hydrolase